MSNENQEYDLEQRTKEFSTDVITFAKKMQKNLVNKSMLDQLIRSATSVGANYREANAASSERDFQNKISICRKEIQETEYWLEILAESNPDKEDEIEKLWKEAHELTLIFNKIGSTLRKENKDD
jgi:four helix bundle protein